MTRAEVQSMTVEAGEHSDQYRAKCFEKHGRSCVICDAEQGIIAHHVDGDRTNNTAANLRPMCRSCHRSVHHGTIPAWSEKLPEKSIIEPHKSGLSDDAHDVLVILAEDRANPRFMREETGMSKGRTDSVLTELCKDGLARRKVQGLYEITDDGRGELTDD